MIKVCDEIAEVEKLINMSTVIICHQDFIFRDVLNNLFSSSLSLYHYNYMPILQDFLSYFSLHVIINPYTQGLNKDMIV
jgi:hypothetical protein